MKLILQKTKQILLSNTVIINEPTYEDINIDISPKNIYNVLSYYHDIIPFYSSKVINNIKSKIPHNNIYHKYLIALKSWLDYNDKINIQVPVANILDPTTYIKDLDLLFRYSGIHISTAALNDPHITFKDFIFDDKSVPFILNTKDNKDIIHISNPEFNIFLYMHDNFLYNIRHTDMISGVTPDEFINSIDDLDNQFHIETSYVYRGVSNKDVLPTNFSKETTDRALTNKLYQAWIKTTNQEKNIQKVLNIPEIELMPKGFELTIPILIVGENISAYTTLNRILNYVDRYVGFTKLSTLHKKDNLMYRLDAIYSNYEADINKAFDSIGLDDKFFKSVYTDPQLNNTNKCYLNAITNTSMSTLALDSKYFHVDPVRYSSHFIFFEHIIDKFPFHIQGGNPNTKEVCSLIKYWLCIRKLLGSFAFLFNYYNYLTNYFFQEERFSLLNYKIRIPKEITINLIKSIAPSDYVKPLFNYKEPSNIKKKKAVESSESTAKNLINIIATLKGTNPDIDNTIKQIEALVNKKDVQ